MDIREIQEGLKKPGKSKSGLAKALGRQPSAVTSLLKGERQLKAHEIKIIREYLELSSQVPIIGSIDSDSEVHFYAKERGFDHAPASEKTTQNSVALEIQGDGLGPGFDGWLAFYDEGQNETSSDLIGSLCIVWLEDGRVLIKVLRKARTEGFYHLHPGGSAGEAISDVRIRKAVMIRILARKQG
jgi:hypothetical protein